MKYEINYTDGMEVSLIKGNHKLGSGIYIFNLMPGSKPISTKALGQITNVSGTCTGCSNNCENSGCYAIRDARRFHNTVIPSIGKNTVIMRHDKDLMFKQLKEKVVEAKVKTLRMHSSGEIEDYEYLEKMVDFANAIKKDMPDLKIYFYTKRFDYISEYFKQHEEGFPDNLTCNLSQWSDNLDKYKDLQELVEHKKLNIFAYDDHSEKSESIKSWKHCPAVKSDGKSTGINCDKCKLCTTTSGSKVAVHKH